MSRHWKRMSGIAPLVAALILTGCGDSDDGGDKASSGDPRPVKVVIVKNAGATLKRSYPAIVLPAKQALLSFRASGKLIELPVLAAQKVKQGDVIARLDPRDFEAEITRLGTQLDQANAKLDAMKKGARSEDVASLQANIDAARSQFRSAQQQVSRTRRLFRKGIVAKARMDQDLSALEVADAQLRAAQEELKKGKAGAREEEVTQQQAVIRGYQTQLKSAEDALLDTTLRAPFSGIIAKREVDNFANVQAKDTIAVLQQLETVDLVFDIPSPDVSPLATRKATLKTEAQVDSLPGKSFPARLIEFATQADAATQTFRGRVAITPTKGAVVLPGMAGQIVITDQGKDVSSYEVPSFAVASDPDGKPFVWVVDKSTKAVSKRYVTTGEATGENIVVTKGVGSGDIVVTAGLSSLRDQMIVRPVSKIGD